MTITTRVVGSRVASFWGGGVKRFMAVSLGWS